METDLVFRLSESTPCPSIFFRSYIRLSNTRKHRIKIYLEPWGEVYELEPNKKLRVDAVGRIGVAPDNMLEIESCKDGTSVWGWGGSGVTVHEVEGQ